MSLHIASEYSNKELLMFQAFGDKYTELANHVHEVSLYDILVKGVFKQDLKGPHVQSLRRCVYTVQRCKPYRMTKAFDNLIQLD